MRDSKKNYLKLQDGSDTYSFGQLMAECDDNLAMYYVGKEKFVDRAINIDDLTTFFIGPKGVGKSAILKMVDIEGRRRGARIVHIKPDDLAFNAISTLDNQAPLFANDNKNQWIFKSMWEYVIVLEVLKAEYPDTAVRSGWLKSLFKGEYEKDAARLIAISESEDGSMTSRLLSMIREVGLHINSPIGGIDAKVSLQQPSLIGEKSVALLNLLGNLSKRLRTQLNHDYYILIDDLDTYWTGTQSQNMFIAALFTALNQISRPPRIKAVVSLREGIYRQLPLPDRDKYPDRIVNVKWDSSSVLQILEMRVTFKLKVAPKEIWGGLFPENSFAMISNATSGRPRESIRLMSIAVQTAVDRQHKAVETEDVEVAIRQFSSARIDEVCGEQVDYPYLAQVVRKFGSTKREMSFDDLREFVEMRCGEVVCGDPGSEKYAWIRGYEKSIPAFAHILLKSGVFRIKIGRKDEPLDYSEDNPVEVSSDRWFAIHPMFAPGLGFGIT